MNLSQVGANMTELALADGRKVLFSYATPVASWEDGQFFKTSKKFSTTTTRHINKWTHCAVIKPQDYFDNFIKA